MRLSTTMIYDMSTQSILQQQGRLAHVRQQLASGQKILTPADAPRDAAQALVMSQSLAVTEQYAATRDIARRNLSTQVVELRSVTNALNAAKPLLVQAANGTLSDADLEAVATELEGVYQQLLDSANAKDGSGRYIFSGFEVNGPAFSGQQGSLSYSGDSGDLKLQVNGNRLMSVSHTAKEIFASVTEGASYVTTADAGNVFNGTADVTQVAITGTPAGDEYEITFNKIAKGVGSDYIIDYTIKNTTTGVQSPPASVTYDASTGTPVTVSMGAGVNGVDVSFKGVPDVGDVFNVTTADGGASYAATGDANNNANGAAEFLNLQVTDPSDPAIRAGDDYNLTFTTVDNTADANPSTYTIHYEIENSTAGGTSTGSIVYDTSKDEPFTIKMGDKGGLSISFDGVPDVGDSFSIAQGRNLGYTVNTPAQNQGDASLSLNITDPSDPDISTRDSYELVFTDGISGGADTSITYEIRNTVDGTVSASVTEPNYVPGTTTINMGDNGDGLQVTLDGTPQTGDTFDIVPASQKHNNILNTFANVIHQLKAGAETDQQKAALRNTIDGTLRALGNSLNNVLTIRSEVGSKLNELDSLDSIGSNRSLNYKTTISSLTDLDFAKAASRYALSMVALKMAQKTFVDIQSLSMFR